MMKKINKTRKLAKQNKLLDEISWADGQNKSRTSCSSCRMMMMEKVTHVTAMLRMRSFTILRGELLGKSRCLLSDGDS